ncbi:DNA-binding transcriptional regulator, MerR family [Yoonia tamlensis]|uniref:DNA-binding transcriptional regulator, MerR family n=1 Tax=Yoonia tamlensis TaxID=390270 RepID=A0A1I6FV82_9RHOB|nr:helix-turn-helix domain-containing protein [Yoonia tamlensis]SFR33834.1 DNA-binding transcriptional regulator, MerR family [Yoonia tamlensis]
MFSIGALSDRTGVKIATIRYYEDMGLLPPPERTAGNQRRYSQSGLDRLAFIKHARDLGFAIDAIKALITLHDHPDRSCAQANAIAQTQLADVQSKIARLRRLETELSRIATNCYGAGRAGDCYVLTSLADHDLCQTKH